MFPYFFKKNYCHQFFTIGTLTASAYLFSLVNSWLRPVKIIFKTHSTLMLSPCDFMNKLFVKKSENYIF